MCLGQYKSTFKYLNKKKSKTWVFGGKLIIEIQNFSSKHFQYKKKYSK